MHHFCNGHECVLEGTNKVVLPAGELNDNMLFWIILEGNVIFVFLPFSLELFLCWTHLRRK